MLEDIIVGEDNPDHLASLARGHLRVKIPQLRLALAGRSVTLILLSVSAFSGSNTVCGNCVARRTLEDIGRQRPDLAQLY